MHNYRSIFILGLLGILVIWGCDNSSTTPSIIDQTPPQWDITIGVQDFDPQDGEVTIYWGSATDSESPPVDYFLFFDTDPNPWDSTPVIVSEINSYTFTGLTNGTEYWAGVRCRDGALPPNYDANITVLRVMPAIPDNDPPQWDSDAGIMSVSAGNGVVTIEWGTATDTQNNPVEYLLYIDYDSDPWDAIPVTSSKHGHYTFTGLKKSKTYWFGVRCRDSFIKPNTDSNDVVLSATLCDGGDPVAPVLLSNASAFTNLVDFEVRNSHVYMIADNGIFSILDASDPYNPVTTGNLNLGDQEEDSIDVQGDFAYIAADKVYIINISDSSNPVISGSLDTRLKKIEVQGNYFYGIYSPEIGGYGPAGLALIDISDPADPNTTAMIDTSYVAGGPNRTYTINLTVNGNYVYIVTFQSLVGYISMGNNFWVIDVTDPAAPVRLGNHFFPSWELTKPIVNNDYVVFYIEYKDDAGAGIEMVDITDPLNPTDVSFLDVCLSDKSLEAYCDYAYQLCDDALRIIDISDPENMSVYTTVMMDGLNCTALEVDSGYAYIAHTTDGLQIYQLW